LTPGPVLDRDPGDFYRDPRPEPAHFLDRLRRGDTLVVVRIDRLARSLSRLLAMLDRLRAAGVPFRSLSDPTHTANRTSFVLTLPSPFTVEPAFA
jgi:DNA invertase Pin-like site-specific DNA recombinase